MSDSLRRAGDGTRTRRSQLGKLIEAYGAVRQLPIVAGQSTFPDPRERWRTAPHAPWTRNAVGAVHEPETLAVKIDLLAAALKWYVTRPDRREGADRLPKVATSARLIIGVGLLITGMFVVSPPAGAVTGGGPNVVISMFSQPGDSIGGGSSQEFDLSNSNISGTLSPLGINLSASSGETAATSQKERPRRSRHD